MLQAEFYKDRFIVYIRIVLSLFHHVFWISQQG